VSIKPAAAQAGNVSGTFGLLVNTKLTAKPAGLMQVSGEVDRFAAGQLKCPV
jgi:hypothetical protein